jgi:hypothetical protein
MLTSPRSAADGLQAKQGATSLLADWSRADTVPADVLAQPSRRRYVPVINQERLVMAGAVGTGSRPGKVNQPVETSALGPHPPAIGC